LVSGRERRTALSAGVHAEIAVIVCIPSLTDLDWKVGEVLSCNYGDTHTDGGIGDRNGLTDTNVSSCAGFRTPATTI